MASATARRQGTQLAHRPVARPTALREAVRLRCEVSASRAAWAGSTLTDEHPRARWFPEGCARGLEPGSSWAHQSPVPRCSQATAPEPGPRAVGVWGRAADVVWRREGMPGSLTPGLVPPLASQLTPEMQTPTRGSAWRSLCWREPSAGQRGAGAGCVRCRLPVATRGGKARCVLTLGAE